MWANQFTITVASERAFRDMIGRGGTLSARMRHRLAIVSSEPAGTRTQDLRINLQPGSGSNYLPDNSICRKEPELAPSPDKQPAVPTGDPDLARILAVWPTLPDHIRAAILALVTTSGAGLSVRRAYSLIVLSRFVRTTT
jgi:hypothetical protein